MNTLYDMTNRREPVILNYTPFRISQANDNSISSIYDIQFDVKFPRGMEPRELTEWKNSYLEGVRVDELNNGSYEPIKDTFNFEPIEEDELPYDLPYSTYTKLHNMKDTMNV
jgi:hypothetical protein